jgi:GDPmannose 4,6-dehydratase
VDILKADWGKAERELGWGPEVDFEQLVCMMVDADLEQLRSRQQA